MSFYLFVTLLSVGALLALSSTQAAPEGRIAGGDDAELGQLPYEAALSIAGLYTCGAVILSEQYALTALYCVCSRGSDRAWPPQMFEVAAGTINLYRGGQRVRLEEITVNFDYNDKTTGIALLKLAQPLVFNNEVRAIPLAKSLPAPNSEIEISGWGRTKQTDENMSPTLQWNYATLLSADECQRIVNDDNDQILCLDHPRKNGICQGDAGSAGVYDNTLIGLAAYNTTDCGAASADVFTSIIGYRDWIIEQISN